MNSVIPCPNPEGCNWPACPLDCKWRPGREDADIVERLRHVLIYGDQEQAITAMEVAADEIEKLKRTIKYGEQLIYESGLRLGEMSRACAELRTENDIMRRHLNLHPDKPLGNELRAEIERLRQERDELITDGVAADAEIERLTAERANRYWEGRYRDEKADNERLTAALKDLRERAVEEGIHHFVNRIDAALVPKP